MTNMLAQVGPRVLQAGATGVCSAQPVAPTLCRWDTTSLPAVQQECILAGRLTVKTRMDTTSLPAVQQECAVLSQLRREWTILWKRIESALLPDFVSYTVLLY